jgi:hypothetical protein
MLSYFLLAQSLCCRIYTQWRDVLLLPVYHKQVVVLIVDEAHCIAMWYVSSKCEHPYIESSTTGSASTVHPSHFVCARVLVS